MDQNLAEFSLEVRMKATKALGVIGGTLVQIPYSNM